MPSERRLKDTVRLGLIQTNCPEGYFLTMTDQERSIYARQLWSFVQGCFASYQIGTERPDIVILPELAVPRRRIFELKSIAQRLGVIVIAGLDYLIDARLSTAVNEAYVIVPEGWRTKAFGGLCQIIKVGKVYPAPAEKQELLKRGYTFKPESFYYVFDAEEIGRFGVAICYDLMDLERATLYGTEIQHLFVLAYNQDTQGFMQIADSLSRVMFCNVVICNTGYFGGSVAIAPYYQPWRRIIYRHEGNALAATQLIEVPAQKLYRAQRGDRERMTDSKPQYLFKNRPPIFEERRHATKAEINLSNRSI